MAEVSRGQLEDIIRAKAYTDPTFRKSLLDNPKQVLANHMTAGLPGDLDVKVIEEKSNVIYISIPPKAVQSGSELSDEALAKVAGGFMDDKMTCNATATLSFASKISLK